MFIFLRPFTLGYFLLHSSITSANLTFTFDSKKRGGAHWARIQKKVQKPPHSTHQIPGFFLSKNPERVDCGGIFNSKFFKSDQKSTEIQWKSSHPPKRGWSDYEKTNPRWVVMLPSKGIHPLFRGSHLT